jgi:hypothetical protein
MGKLSLGNLLVHNETGMTMRIISTNLSENSIVLRMEGGQWDGRIITRGLGQVSEKLANGEFKSYKETKTKQEFKMTPVKFIHESKREVIITPYPHSQPW